VLSVYRAGFEWNGELLRPAEVKVGEVDRGDGIMSEADVVVGIDLGTTNSEVAAFL